MTEQTATVGATKVSFAKLPFASAQFSNYPLEQAKRENREYKTEGRNLVSRGFERRVSVGGASIKVGIVVRKYREADCPQTFSYLGEGEPGKRPWLTATCEGGFVRGFANDRGSDLADAYTKRPCPLCKGTGRVRA